MKRLWKSMIVSLLCLAGTAFVLSSHADEGGNLSGLAAGNSDQPARIQIECEDSMESLPINGEVRTKRLPVGVWAGEHISMKVTKGRTTVEYDCARASIEQRIALDRRGRFSVSGMQFPEHGGPVRQNEETDGYPVQFAGQVSGKKMTLSVIEKGAKTPIGNFTLVFGAEPKLRKCR